MPDTVPQPVLESPTVLSVPKTKRFRVFGQSEEEFNKNSCRSICETVLRFPPMSHIKESKLAPECIFPRHAQFLLDQPLIALVSHDFIR